jgi:hypothetical protein
LHPLGHWRPRGRRRRRRIRPGRQPDAAALGGPDDTMGRRDRLTARLRCSRRGGRHGRRLRLGFGLRRPAEALGISEAAHTIGLRVLDTRGVALDSDPQAFAEIKGFLVGQPELSCQLVHPDPLVRHLCSANPFQRVARRAVRDALALAQQSSTQPLQLMPRDLAAQCPPERPALHGGVEAGHGTGAQPGSPARRGPPHGE